MSFRLLNQFPVYLGNTGRPAANGTLRFYESGTTTPKDVYGDPGLTVNNGPALGLKADGRPEHDVWGEGSYRVRLYASDDTLIAEADDVEVPGGTGAEIPALVDGYFLTNNGALMLWAPIIQVPDPTGQSGKQLGNDGENLIWEPKPTAPEAPTLDVAVTDTSLRVGDGVDATKMLVQLGSDSAPATGAYSTSKTVTFPTAFSTAPKVFVMPTSQSQPGGPVVTELSSAPGTASFTVTFDVAEGGSKANMVNPVPFDWLAIGTKEVTA